MTGRRSASLLALLGASCVVQSFSIVDELPGAGASGGSAGAAGSTSAGTGTGQGGSNTAGSGTTPGGKSGSAGAASQAGAAVAMGGEPAIAAGGAGEGGAPAIVTAPCDLDATGQPPLLCDDFEEGVFQDSKWVALQPVAIEPGEGPHGTTNLVRIPPSQGLATTLGDFTLAGGFEVTLSFWLKWGNAPQGTRIMRFRDLGLNNRSIRLVLLEQGLGWQNDKAGMQVPTTPTDAMLLPGQWVCVSINMTDSSIVLSYRSNGAQTTNTLTIDSTPTPGVDDLWQNQPEPERFIGGFPSFGSDPGFPGDIFIDDVRIVRGTSSICPF